MRRMNEKRDLAGGVTLTYDVDHWEVPVGDLRLAAAHQTPVDWLVRRLESSGKARSHVTATLHAKAAAQVQALDATRAPQLHVALAHGEVAALLVESEGVVAWQFPDAVEASSHALFTVRTPGLAAAHTGQRRAFVGLHWGNVKAVVLKFVAGNAAGIVVERLERDKRTGPVVISSSTDPTAWEKPAEFPVEGVPRDRPAKLLLFVHGTFSSTAGAFADLCATPEGQSLLEKAREHYDAVFGWDHRTLSLAPDINARELYKKLRAMDLPRPPVIDIVCHSRGGLVARSLIETILPQANWAPAIGRVVFTAATNAGTQLARPANWKSLIDLFTNLAMVRHTVLGELGANEAALAAGEVVEWIGDFVGYLIEAAFEDGAAPGLAAMNPDGPFVAAINRTLAGEPKAADAHYYAIESDFQVSVAGGEHEPREFPPRLALMLANGFVDTLMKKAKNDLVVDVKSMISIDAAAGDYVKGVRDFGTNAAVYHTNYFLRPETVQSIVEWLGLGAANTARPREAGRAIPG